MKDNTIPLTTLEEFSSETVGHDILRYICLPDFLGREKDNLLYYIGKNLARNLELTTLDNLNYVFDKLKWGKLEMVKDKRKTMTFHLMSDEIVQRLQSSITTEFRLEAGFLAEAIYKITNRACEVTETVNEKIYRIDFKVFFLE